MCVGGYEVVISKYCRWMDEVWYVFLLVLLLLILLLIITILVLLMNMIMIMISIIMWHLVCVAREGGG